MTAQRSGDGTVLSFRLQPGATAHVEQRANKLDVVVTVPGGSPGVASSRTGEATRSNPLDSSRNAETINRSSAPKNVNGNDARASFPAPLQSNLNSNRKAASAVTAARATPTPIAYADAGDQGVRDTERRPLPASPLKAAVAKASPTDSPATATTQPQPDLWTRMKERGHYWLLLAQLNPMPVAVGAGVLILLIGLIAGSATPRQGNQTRQACPGRNKESRQLSQLQ